MLCTNYVKHFSQINLVTELCSQSSIHGLSSLWLFQAAFFKISKFYILVMQTCDPEFHPFLWLNKFMAIKCLCGKERGRAHRKGGTILFVTVWVICFVVNVCAFISTDKSVLYCHCSISCFINERQPT